MLISVHIPKTGGSSLKHGLHLHFGDSLRLDYADRPLAHSPFVRNMRAWAASFGTPYTLAGANCVHGHFLPKKYSRVPDATFITWLRDSVERLVSRYHFAKRAWDSGSHEINDRQLLRLIVERKGEFPSLDCFAALEKFRNTYAKYFWRFDMERFAFIGITEDWETSIRRLAEVSGVLLDAQTALNRNPERESKAYEIDSRLRRRVTACNELDVQLYEWARSKGTPTK